MYLSKLDLNLNSKATTNWLKNPYNVHIDLWKAFPNKKNINDPQPFLYRFELNYKRIIILPRILVLSSIEPNWDNILKDKSNILLKSPEVKQIKNLDFIKKDAYFRFSLIANPTKKIIDYRKLFQEELKNYPKNYSRKEHKKYFEAKNKLNELIEKLPEEQKLKFIRDKKNKKKVGIYDEYEQIAWLQRQGKVETNKKGGGFELIEVKINTNNSNLSYWSVLTSYTESKFIQILKKDKITNIELPPIKIHTVHYEGVLKVTSEEHFKFTFTHGIGSGKAFGCGLLLLANY